MGPRWRTFRDGGCPCGASAPRTGELIAIRMVSSLAAVDTTDLSGEGPTTSPSAMLPSSLNADGLVDSVLCGGGGAAPSSSRGGAGGARRGEEMLSLISLDCHSTPIAAEEEEGL